ncbi:efflux RND transporter periplasmic adaptor subunit [Komagataeibacter oboediens]|uniref:efflux RND transporter periplasmic adaptor subunit n=1 Tax=Komagataeibacter oboediens TaxID=65958 RepID=UPI0020C552C5|nr:efflux RND transporter periplasmic adaptor subunit [Komagataeibacter oboediens]
MSCRTRTDILARVLPLVAASCLLGCKPASSPVKHAALPAVQALMVHDASPQKAAFIGLYGAERSIPLAPTQAGRLTSVSVVSGQYVHQGDVLATFEDRLLLEMEAQSQGEVDAACAEMNQAAATYKRSRGLDAIGGLSSGTVEERAYSWHLAQAKYRSALAALTQAQIQVAESKIRAPEDGWIMSVTGVPGSLVGAGSEIIRLSAGAPEVHFKVPSSSSWTVGDTAEVSLPAGQDGQSVRADIREIGTIDATSQMQDVKLRLDHPLPVAVNSLVTVVLAAHDVSHVVRVPLTAVDSAGQTHAHLWGLTDGQTPHLVLRSVRIVGLRGADALVEGLTDGEWIVSNTDGSFQQGQAVLLAGQAGER